MGDAGPGARLSELSIGTVLYLYFLSHAALFGVVLYATGRRDLAYAVSVLVMLVGGLKEAWDDLQALLA